MQWYWQECTRDGVVGYRLVDHNDRVRARVTVKPSGEWWLQDTSNTLFEIFISSAGAMRWFGDHLRATRPFGEIEIVDAPCVGSSEMEG